MLEGSINLIRPLAEHWIWTSEKFTKGQAWVDLILLANDGPASINKNGQVIHLDRGDIGWNQASLARRWHWGNKTTVSFWFKKLCREGMLSKIGEGETAVFRIVNYDLFNPPECTGVAPVLHGSCTSIAPKWEREGEKEASRVRADDVPSQEQFLEFTRTYRGQMASGIPAGIPDVWALDTFNWLMDEAERGRPWNKNWRASVRRRFETDWVADRRGARGDISKKSREKAPWMLKREAAELRDQIDTHPANPRGVSYAGEDVTEEHRKELKYLKTRLRQIEGQMSEGGDND